MHMQTVRCARSTAATGLVLSAMLIVSPTDQAKGAAEDILAGAFDKVTGVPFASTMLAIVKQGESSPLSPAALDARLTQVEALLRDVDQRLHLVEQRLSQLENQVVKVSNINRLRTLQRIKAELSEIVAELQTKPADPGARAILEFRARQQADLIKNDPDFDVWKWSDITNPGQQDQAVRTRFLVYPSFELYSLAINTWFVAIELNSGPQPQRVVSESGGFLRDHEAFLETRGGLPEILDDPVTLPEHLHAAAFCRLEAVDKFSNNAGDCLFASVCIDNMADTSTETGQQTLHLQPPRAGTLCTASPNQSVGLPGEDDLRNKYGAELMAALAHSLARLATTGSLRDPFVGQFANFIQTQIFSVPLDGPMLAPRGAAPGAIPAIPKCIPSVGSGGCFFGVQLSQETGWTVANTNPAVVGGGGGLMIIRNNSSNLCFDVKNSSPASGAPVVLWSCNGSASQVWNLVKIDNVHYTLAAGNTQLCATVEPPAIAGSLPRERRGLLLQPCDRRDLQLFSNRDSKFVGPN
jgi:hypothetical protein